MTPSTLRGRLRGQNTEEKKSDQTPVSRPPPQAPGAWKVPQSESPPPGKRPPPALPLALPVPLLALASAVGVATLRSLRSPLSSQSTSRVYRLSTH